MSKPLRKNVVKCLLICESLAELRSCVKVKADVLDSPSLIICTVSVDVKQRLKKKKKKKKIFLSFRLLVFASSSVCMASLFQSVCQTCRKMCLQ